MWNGLPGESTRNQTSLDQIATATSKSPNQSKANDDVFDSYDDKPKSTTTTEGTTPDPSTCNAATAPTGTAAHTPQPVPSELSAEEQDLQRTVSSLTADDTSPPNAARKLIFTSPPQNQGKEDDTKKTPPPMTKIFKDAGYSPPEIHEEDPDVDVADVQHLAVYVSQEQDVVPAWDNLSKDQQAKLSFIKLRCYDTMIKEINGSPEAALKLALDEKTAVGKRLKNVMRQGGDIGIELGIDNQSLTLESFFLVYPEWRDPVIAPTIFNGGGPKKVKPLYRLQNVHSTMCYLIAPLTVIYYKYMDPENILNSLNNVVNVNHFIRDRFGKERSFAYIFQGDGGCSSETLYELLRPWNPKKSAVLLTETINMGGNRFSGEKGRSDLYNTIRSFIKAEGAGLIRIRVFEQLLKRPEQVMWTGDFGSDDISALDKDKYPYDGHTLVAVGVKETPGEHGGMLLLAQNSWRKNMWLVLGMDLLLSMGKPCHVMTFIQDDAEFKPLDEKVNHGVKFFQKIVETGSGSPHPEGNIVDDSDECGGFFPLAPKLPESQRKPMPFRDYTMAGHRSLVDKAPKDLVDFFVVVD